MILHTESRLNSLKAVISNIFVFEFSKTFFLAFVIFILKLKVMIFLQDRLPVVGVIQLQALGLSLEVSA